MVLIKNENLTPSSILVVDDDRTALMTLEALLQSYGYKVITAISGKSACEIIEKEHKVIDAILLDRMMPEMDGLQVIEWLKKTAESYKNSDYYANRFR